MIGKVLKILYKGEDGKEYVRCIVKKWEFRDKAMSVGEQCLTFELNTENLIPFAIGDYCEYRGQQFFMNNLPSVVQVAEPMKTGNAFKYESVKMESAACELGRVTLLDITPSTSLYTSSLGTNYTGSANFQLFCGSVRGTFEGKTVERTPVCVLAGRIQANLDRVYKEKKWKVHVNLALERMVDGTMRSATHSEDKVLSFNNTTVAGAMAEVQNAFKLSYFIKGRDIYIGYALGTVTGKADKIADKEDDFFYFGYGRGYADKKHQGKSLFEIKKVANPSQQIITRLRAFGSKKNIPFRYYNKRYDLSQSFFPQNLQLPDTFETLETKKQRNELRKKQSPNLRAVLGDTNDAYIEKNDDSLTTTEGLREGVAAWDGSNQDLEEIYPTIKGVTFGDLRGNDTPDMFKCTEKDDKLPKKDGEHRSFWNYQDKERIDEILAVGELRDKNILHDDAHIGMGIMPGAAQNRYGAIDCPCLINEHFELNSSIMFYHSNAYELFHTLKAQPSGRYMLYTQAGDSLIASTVVNTGRFASNGIFATADVSFEIVIYAKPCRPNSKKEEIARYRTRTVHVHSKDIDLSHAEVKLPNLPDYFDKTLLEKNEDMQVPEIIVKEVSDISATIRFDMVNINTDMREKGENLYIDFHVGNTQGRQHAKNMNDYGLYLWGLSTEQQKTIDDPFHIIIKDLGIPNFTAQFTGKEDAQIEMRDGNCVCRQFSILKPGAKRVKYIKDGKEYNGWELKLKRSVDDSIHTYYPSGKDKLKAGDHFVILGIEMPDSYIKAAEMRLLAAASRYLEANSKTMYSYEPHLDEIYLARNYDNCEKEGDVTRSVYWNLYAGLKFPFRGIPKSANKEEELPAMNVTIESLTIKEGDGLIPKVELKLNEKIEQGVYQRVTNTVNKITEGNFFGDVLESDVVNVIKKAGREFFISKIFSDISNDFITFLKGIGAKAKSFFTGIDNEGDLNNTGEITTKDLIVTGTARFLTLEIAKAKAAGGVIVQSIADFHIDDVEETEEGYVCYQVAEKDGVKLRQMCQEGDQMLCYGAFNTEIKTAGNNSQFYWRYVSKAPLETEMRYLEYDKATECLKIVLSKGDCAGYSTAPQRGDGLVQMGHRTDKERQSVIVLAATFPLLDDLKPPYWAKYTGINNYELTAHRETFFSKDKNQIIGTLLTKAEDGTYQPIPDDLVKQFSEIKQTANKISFKVAEQDKGLRAAGIDIESGQIVATADNFKVKNSSGTETFLINKDGQITADNISLDGLDAKDAVIKNLKMQSNYTLSPFFLTNETLHEFLDHAYKPYAGWGSYYAWPFDFASFIVIGSEEVITKKHITGFLDSGMWEDFTTNRNEMKPESSWGSSFYSDYYKVPKITYWLSLLGKTVMIANSINRSFGFGVEIPDRERYIRKHAPLDLMDLPEHTYQGGFFNYVSLLPNQIGIFKYVTVSGAPDFAKKDKDYKPKVYGVWLKQAVYDFNITANIIKAAYDVDPNFSIFEEKYLNLFGKKGHTWDYNLPKERKE